MTGPFLRHPLDTGARVALDVWTAAHAENATDGVLRDMRAIYDAPADVVVLAVPPGEGVVVAHFLEKAFAVETVELPASHPSIDDPKEGHRA